MLVDFGDPGVDGTDGWQSPEQVTENEQSDARSDLFSVGIIASLLFQAEHPFVDPHHLTLPRELIANHNPRGIEKLPERVRPWISMMLQRNPEDRFQTAEGALAAFRETKTSV